jgi:hypothetical protein
MARLLRLSRFTEDCAVPHEHAVHSNMHGNLLATSCQACWQLAARFDFRRPLLLACVPSAALLHALTAHLANDAQLLAILKILRHAMWAVSAGR